MVVRNSRPKFGRSTALVHHPADDMLEEVDDTALPQPMNYTPHPTMDSSDLFIPRLRLAQGLTTEVQNGDAKPGEWLILGEDPMKQVRIVPVGMTKRRELRDPDSRGVLCRSSDAVTGVGNPGGECAQCPMAQWSKPRGPSSRGRAAAQRGSQRDQKNDPPACSFLYSYMVYLLDLKQVAILEFSRTSISAGKMLNTMIVQRGVGNFAVTLGSVGKTGPRGTFYGPTVAPVSVKPDVLKRALTEMKRAMGK